MGGRYWISGVQIGILLAALQRPNDDLISSANEVLEKIQEEQFIGKNQDLKKMIK